MNHSRTLIGIVTFGNFEFTRLAIEEIRRTVKNHHYAIMVIIGKPGDQETRNYLTQNQHSYIEHKSNLGFPASINDIYDWAWKHFPETAYDNVIIMGNDVVPYPHAIDAMIDLADRSDWEWICSSQFDSKSLCARYPMAQGFFRGPSLIFSDFTARPWDLHLPAFRQELEATPAASWLEPDCIKDVRNLCLFKRSVFEKIGYADVNFWPGGYFEDNDYCTRARLTGIKACGLRSSAYFHFWSRTIHQVDGAGSANDFYFGHNQTYYREKWGGDFGKENLNKPIPTPLRISSRVREDGIIEHWRKLRA